IQNIPARIPERENSLLFQVLKEDHYNSHQIIAGLEEETDFYDERIQIDDAQYKQAYKAHDQKQKKFHQAQIITQKFRTLEEKQKLLNDKNEQIPMFDQKEKQLALAERASNITLYEKQANEWRQTEKEKRHVLAESEKAKKLADDHFQQVQATYEREKRKQEKRDDLKRHVERLNHYLPVVKAIDTKQNELNELKKNVEEAQSGYDEVTSGLKAKMKELEGYEQKVEQSERALESLSEKEEKIQDMREQHRMLKHYIDLYNQHNTLTQKLNQQKEVYQKAKNMHDTFEEKWLN